MANSPPSEYMIFGDLPEHIILHILSFLPTKIAIATSVLSKTWEHRWTLVPALDFTHCYDQSLSRDFVDKAFERNKALFMRRLVITPQIYGITQSDLSYYVSYAIQRNVQELALNLRDKFVFPCSINTLVFLKLTSVRYNGTLLLLGDNIFFPSLKILHLTSITLESRDSSLLGFSSSRFPLLEEMVLRSGGFNNQVHISLPKLTYLEISFVEFKYALKIQSLDSLRLLVFDGSIGRDFHVENVPKIVRAEFNICGNGNVRDDEFHGDSLISLVNAISQAKILKLSCETIEELYKATLNSSFHDDGIQVFHNLVKIELPLDDHLFDMAMIMLHKLENLQHLAFVHVKSRGRRTHVREGKIVWSPPTHVPNCLTKRLMTFCFRQFRGTEDEMEITKYILKNSLVLVNAEIAFMQRVQWNDRVRIRRELSTSIGSVGCELEFDQWERNPKSQFGSVGCELEFDQWERNPKSQFDIWDSDDDSD